MLICASDLIEMEVRISEGLGEECTVSIPFPGRTAFLATVSVRSFQQEYTDDQVRSAGKQELIDIFVDYAINSLRVEYFKHYFCECGHNKLYHDGFFDAGECMVEGCQCKALNVRKEK